MSLFKPFNLMRRLGGALLLLLSAGLLTPFSVQALTPMELMMLKPQPDVTANGVGIFVYNGMNAMDALGPMQVFSSAGLKPFLIAKDKTNPIVASNGLSLNVGKSIAEVERLDILVVPGGAFETIQQTEDPEVIAWIQKIDQNTVYTTSVCTGAWILGKAGLLKGKYATSNWYRAAEILRKFRAKPQPGKRYVFDGKLVTGAGVTAGLDMSMAIIEKLFSHDENNGHDYTQAIMLENQYDPHPPVRGGSPRKTDPLPMETMQFMYDYYLHDWVTSLPLIPK